MNLKTAAIFIFAMFLINETTAQKEGVYVEAEILEGWVPNFNKLSRMRPVNSGNISGDDHVVVIKYVVCTLTSLAFTYKFIHHNLNKFVTVPERIKLTKFSKYGAPAPASPLG
ncbi:unnamed protein product [Orchesella dallaii]|uniref:Uncharacterized protein n=1 Tax=Orchesella dallaii TaxID=48710 RepID=A0ABP1R4U4_9HEXA